MSSQSTVHAPETAYLSFAKKQEDRLSAPFTDRRYRLEARRRDGTILIGRCVAAPVFPRLPAPEEATPFDTFAARVEPLYFAANLVNHYRIDFFSGMEPSESEPVNHVLAQWNPNWVTQRGKFFQFLTPVEDLMTEHASVADEVAKRLGVEHDRRRTPSYSESLPDLRRSWKSWADNMVVYWSILMDKLIGEEEWRTLKNKRPTLYERMERLCVFDYPLVGAWFKDPVRHLPYVNECIERGIPVYYTWTPAIESSSAAAALRPVLDKTRQPVTPPGLPPVPLARGATPSSPTAARGERSPPASTQHRPSSQQTTPTTSPRTQSATPRVIPATLWSTAPGAYASTARQEAPPSRNIYERFNIRPDSSPTSGTSQGEQEAPQDPDPEEKEKETETESLRSSTNGAAGQLNGHLALVPMRVLTWNPRGLPTDPLVTLAVQGLEFVTDSTPRVVARPLPGVPEKIASMHREHPIEDLDDFVTALLSIRARFDTLVYVESPRPRNNDHFVPPQYFLSFNMKREEVMRKWREAALYVLKRPHGFRAAIQMGGIIATIARDLMPTAIWSLEPTRTIWESGCPYPLQLEGHYAHDDYLADAEIKILIGFDWSTVDAKPCDQRSMFPPPEVWERVAHGVWSQVHQDWYELRKGDIISGREGPSFYLIKRFIARLEPWVPSLRLGHHINPALGYQFDARSA